LVENGGQSTTHSFWADNETEEQAIWFKLLKLLGDLGDFTLFHYGAYEKGYMKKMLPKYPSPDIPLPNDWASTLFNVVGATRTNVYFPTYSNGLKDIGKYLGIIWSGMVTSGIECVAARLRWEESKDPATKEQIIDYNRRDCLALQRVTEFLVSLRTSEMNQEVRMASQIAAGFHRPFGKIEFAVPEMNFINRCARFDYQRDKVLLRTEPKAKVRFQREHKKARKVQTANVEVQCPAPPRCPFCGSGDLTLYSNLSISKLVYDLKISRYGIRRWAVRYVTKRHLCRACDRSFHSEAYPTKEPKIGHGLSSWAVYQNVALSQSYADIMTSVNDLFGYTFTYKIGLTALYRLAAIYRASQETMLERLRSGTLLHADETKLKIKHSILGYVWAFTSTETVVYLYHATKEGTFLKETIGDFGGVLASDFYAAYDSVTCRQQKCHLHLMRDINDDLLRHPFDEELKELARRYTLTLKPMVETIDKHGLNTKFLSKHKRNANNFLDWIA
jgi:hypothetical protein